MATGKERQLAMLEAIDGLSVSDMEVLHDLVHRRLDELTEAAKIAPDEAMHQEYHDLESLHTKLFDIK